MQITKATKKRGAYGAQVAQERALIERVAKAENLTVEKIERRSDRPYDLSISGKLTSTAGAGKTVHFTDEDGKKGSFTMPASTVSDYSGWLPLTAIHALRGAAYGRAVAMSDYPEMGGDWSGIRDSDSDTIWRIFTVLCLGTCPKCNDAGCETKSAECGR